MKKTTLATGRVIDTVFALQREDMSFVRFKDLGGYFRKEKEEHLSMCPNLKLTKEWIAQLVNEHGEKPNLNPVKVHVILAEPEAK